jgi:hypothetical protein
MAGHWNSAAESDGLPCRWRVAFVTAVDISRDRLAEAKVNCDAAYAGNALP